MDTVTTVILYRIWVLCKLFFIILNYILWEIKMRICRKLKTLYTVRPDTVMVWLALHLCPRFCLLWNSTRIVETSRLDSHSFPFSFLLHTAYLHTGTPPSFQRVFPSPEFRGFSLVAERLPYKYKTLNSIPSTKKQKIGIQIFLYFLSLYPYLQAALNAFCQFREQL